MNVMAMLVRREFWEHRALLIAPVALCILYLVICAFAGANINARVLQLGSQPPTSAAVLMGMQLAFTTLLYFLMAVVAFFYLCDCLYSERKDRSILFWKSLPVSDTMTVLSKVAVALIAIPVVVYVLALATNVIAFTVFKLLFKTATPAGFTSDWTMGSWVRLNGYLIVDIFVLALWYAPIVGYQLLISVLVPRAVFVCTVLPPLALIFGERLFLGTWHIGLFLAYRLAGVTDMQFGIRTAQGVIDSVSRLPLLKVPDLWIGAVVAAVLIYATIRIRRHQDDT